MPPFTPCFPGTLRDDDVPVALLDLVQQRLAGLLGPRFTVTLNGSGTGEAARHYRLAIQDLQSGLWLEDTGVVGDGFVEHLLRLGAQTRTMLESATFGLMGTNNPNRPLVWISEPVLPIEFRPLR